MHRTVLLIVSACLYFVLGTYGLVIFDAGIILTSIVLFGIPAYVFAHYSAAPTTVLSTVAVFGAGLSILLEGIFQDH